MTRAAVARRYARALAALAHAEGRLDPVAEELARFEHVLGEEAALRQVLLWPWVKAATQRAVVAEVAARLGLSRLVRNFLALVAQRRRFALFAEMTAAYRALADEVAGRARARVTSAVPLTDAEQAALRERLGRRLGRAVTLETRVDPGLLGGFVAEVGGRVLDASLTGQLGALRERITGGTA